MSYGVTLGANNYNPNVRRTQVASLTPSPCFLRMNFAIAPVVGTRNLQVNPPCCWEAYAYESEENVARDFSGFGDLPADVDVLVRQFSDAQTATPQSASGKR